MMHHGDRGNCFDIIRHVAAFTVLFSHHFALLGRGDPTVPNWDSYGFMAVAVFFSISGYLMPGAFQRSGNFLQFIRRRLRRLLPAMIVCAFLLTYVLGALYRETSLVEYLTSKWALRNFAMWSMFYAQPMPGVFADFIVPNAVNGSLWTLPIELACYLILGATLSFGNPLQAAMGLFIGSVLGTMWITHTGTGFSLYGVPLNYLFAFGLCFSAGSLLALTERAWLPMRWHLLVFAFIWIWLLRGRPEINVFGTLGITVLTIVIGRSFSERLINGRFDISYGVYIYAFPIQQLVINLVTRDVWTSMAISVVLTAAAGYLSYRFVERPFLRVRKAEPAHEVVPLAGAGAEA